MYKYKLVEEHDANKSIELISGTFTKCLEEALGHLNWYLTGEDGEYVACETNNPNHCIELKEKEYEDAQYELITSLGYRILAVK
jgi:hypothetical protein